MIKKYGGDLIYCTTDAYGVIEVIDYPQAFRGFHFDHEYQQSSLLLFNPAILIQNYTQAMLTPLCWHIPSRVLLLGMGGGSQINYLLKFSEHIFIDCVELRTKVITIAHEYFMLPRQDERLAIITGSAETYLQTNTQRYDLILIDLFLQSHEPGFAPDQDRIHQQLWNSLNNKGSICINILGKQHQQYRYLDSLINTFNGYCYSLPVAQNQQILIITKDPIPASDAINFSYAENQYGLSFRKNFNRIRKWS